MFCSGRVFCSGVLRLDLSASGVLFGAAAPMRCLSVCFVRAFHVLFGVRVLSVCFCLVFCSFFVGRIDRLKL